ncbi:MAG: hypothetical protein Q9183_004566, partial [Haloplaca sp. 2 TL-2023]
EATSSRVHLADDEPFAVDCMIDFMYTQKYDVQAKGYLSFEANSQYFVTKVHLAIHTLGGKYGVPALCRFALDSLCECLSQEDSLPSLIPSIPLLYEHLTDDEEGKEKLRKFVITELKSHVELMSPSEAELQELMDHLCTIPAFHEDFCREWFRLAGEQRNHVFVSTP